MNKTNFAISRPRPTFKSAFSTSFSTVIEEQSKMGDHDKARDKAARLLKKQGSMSSLASSDIRQDGKHHRPG